VSIWAGTFVIGDESSSFSPSAGFSVQIGGEKAFTSARYATLISGKANEISSDATYALVLGGFHNNAVGKFGVVIGGSKNSVLGTKSLAMGYNAKNNKDYSAIMAFHDNSMVSQHAASDQVPHAASDQVNLSANTIKMAGTLDLVGGDILNSQESGNLLEIERNVKKFKEQTLLLDEMLHDLEDELKKLGKFYTSVVSTVQFKTLYNGWLSQIQKDG